MCVNFSQELQSFALSEVRQRFDVWVLERDTKATQYTVDVCQWGTKSFKIHESLR